jgi:hypothetical protein
MTINDAKQMTTNDGKPMTRVAQMTINDSEANDARSTNDYK